MHVMLGMSLRARWDATLVNIIEIDVNKINVQDAKWSSASSGMSCTAVLVCSIEQSNPPS